MHVCTLRLKNDLSCVSRVGRSTVLTHAICAFASADYVVLYNSVYVRPLIVIVIINYTFLIFAFFLKDAGFKHCIKQSMTATASNRSQKCFQEGDRLSPLKGY